MNAYTLICSRRCLPLCVFEPLDHLNAGEINIDPWQPLKLALKTVLIQHTPRRFSQAVSPFFLSLIQKLCLFFVSPTNHHPHPTVLPLVCFIFPVALLCSIPSLPSRLCFLLQPACCISSPPQRGSGISCNHLYLCSVPPVSAGSRLLCCCTPHIPFLMQLYPTAVRQVGVVYNYALCVFVPAMFLDVFAHA